VVAVSHIGETCERCNLTDHAGPASLLDGEFQHARLLAGGA